MLKQLFVGIFVALIAGSTLADSSTLEAQKRLSSKGYDVGVVDGIMGSQTRGALKKFQQDTGLPATGRLDKATRSKLGITAQRKQRSVQYYAPTQRGGHTTAVEIAPPTMKCPQCEVMVNGRWQCKSRSEVKKYPGAPAMCK